MNINSVNLSEVTTYRFGGICKNFINIETEDDLIDLKNVIKEKQNVGKDIWQSFYPDNKKEYLNRETMKFQKEKPSKGTRAMNPYIKFLPPG